MRKPGGFRRCIVILANHPELYPLERICAWLHHETTGMWPNEGNHHAGGKLGKITRVIKKPRRRKRRKSSDVEIGIDVKVERIERRFQRQAGSMIHVPLDGTNAQIDFKSSAGKRVVSAVESVLLPGEHGGLSPRHIGATALTPGGSGLPGPKLGLTPGRALRRSTGNTRGFRCPPGFERGGHFTDSRFSTCGRQLFGIPGSGRSALRTVSAEVNKQQREKVGAAYAEFKAQPTVGAEPPTAGVEQPAAGVGGGMPEMPETVGPADTEKQAAAITQVLESMSKATAATDKPVRRLIREDGSILQPLAPLEIIGKQKNNPDLKNAALITRINNAERFGKDELALMQTGLSSVDFSIPGGGSVSLKRNGGLMPPGKARAFGKAISAASKAEGDSLDYGALLRETAARTDAVTYTVTLPGERDPSRLVRVTGGGVDERVPYWVYATFLAEGAPGKGANATPYTMEEAVGKSLKAVAVKRLGESVMGSSWGPLQYTAALIPDYDAIDRTVGVAYKAMAYTEYRRDISWAFVEEKRASSVWDRGINRFRCPPGMTNAGQITNRFGIGCGKAVMDRMFNVLRDSSHAVMADERGSIRMPGRNRTNTPNVPNVPGRRGRISDAFNREGGIGDRIANAIRGDADDTRFGAIAAEVAPERGGRFGQMIDRMVDAVDVGGNDDLAGAVLEGRRSRRELEDEERPGVTDRIRTALHVEDRDAVVEAAMNPNVGRPAPDRRRETPANDPARIAGEVDGGTRLMDNGAEVAAALDNQRNRSVSRRLAVDTPETARTLFDARDRNGLEAMRLRHEENRLQSEAALRTSPGILTVNERVRLEDQISRNRNFEGLASRFLTRLDAEPATAIDPFVARDNSLPTPRPPARPAYDATMLSVEERASVLVAVGQYKAKIGDFWGGRLGDDISANSIDDYVRGKLQNQDILPGHRNTLLRYREDWAHFQNAGTDEDGLLNIPNLTSEGSGRRLLVESGVVRPNRRSRIAPEASPMVTNTPGDGLSPSTPESPEITSVVTESPWVPSAELVARTRVTGLTVPELVEGGAGIRRTATNPRDVQAALFESRLSVIHSMDAFSSGAVDNPEDLLAALSEATETHAYALVAAATWNGGAPDVHNNVSATRALGEYGSVLPSQDITTAGTVQNELEQYDTIVNRARLALSERGITGNSMNRATEDILADASTVSSVNRVLAREINGVNSARAAEARRVAVSTREYSPTFFKIDGSGDMSAPMWSIGEDGRNMNLNAAGMSDIFGGLSESEWGVVPGLEAKGLPDGDFEVMYRIDYGGSMTINMRDRADHTRSGHVTLSFSRYVETDGPDAGKFSGRVRINAEYASIPPNFQNSGAVDAATMWLAMPAMGSGYVGRVDTSANITIGTYAWASKGFDFTDGATPSFVRSNARTLRDFLNNPGDIDARAKAESMIWQAVRVSKSGSPSNGEVDAVMAAYLLNKGSILESLDNVADSAYTIPRSIAMIGKPRGNEVPLFPEAGIGVNFHPGLALFLSHSGSYWKGVMIVPGGGDAGASNRAAGLQ